MKKILYFSNIPSPYRSRFFKGLGLTNDLTIIYEAESSKKVKFSFSEDDFDNQQLIFLSKNKVNRVIPNFIILKQLKKLDFDYIILTNYGHPTELLVYLVFKLLNIKYFFEFDGALIREENLLKYLFKKFILSGAIGYFSPSKIASDYLIHYGVDSSKITQYPFSSVYSKDIKKLSIQDKMELRNKLRIKDDLVLLFVGRIIYAKGLDILIDALSKLDYIAFRLIIIGDSPDEKYLNKVKNSLNTDLINKITILDFMSSKELDEYYHVSDIFVFPTRYDPWGLVLNEAMSKGLAVIASNKSVSANQLIRNGENGFVYQYDDAEELRYKLLKLIESEFMRLRFGLNALITIKDYTIEKMVQSHLDIFN